MKKEVLIFAILSSIFLSNLIFVSAVEISLSKDSYSPQETLQAEIQGNFLTLSIENIQIYEQGIPRPNPVFSDLTGQEDKYYFYAILPNKEGNYSFVIENTQYITRGELNSEKIIKNFTIIRTNQSYLSINPGFIIASGDFSVKIKSPMNTQRIAVTLQATNQTKFVNLIESDEKKLDFSISGISSNKTSLMISSYNIPIFIKKNINPPGTELLVFSPKELRATVAAGDDYFFELYIENFGDKNISNIRFSNDLNALIEPETIGLLKRGERKIVNLTLPVSQNAKNNLSGQIKAWFGNASINMDAFFEITKNNSNVNLTGTTITPYWSCSSRGKICVYPEQCTKETTESLEGPCCLGECKVPQQPADYGWIFGLLILAVLAIVAFFLIKKAKAKQKLRTPEKMLEETSKKYNRRNAPSVPSKEVSGNIGRV